MRIKLLFMFLLVVSNVSAVSPGQKSAYVKTTKMQKKTLSQYITCYGVIEPDPAEVYSVSFNRAGQITHLSITPGQIVKQGEVLAEFATDPSLLKKYHEDLTLLKFAEKDLANVKSLVELKLATQTQYATAEKALADAQAQVLLQKQLGNDVAKETARSPVEGIVTAVNVLPGQHLPAGTSIVELVKKQGTRARLEVDPEAFLYVDRGMKVILSPIYNHDDTMESSVQDLLAKISLKQKMAGVLAPLSKKSDAWILGLEVQGKIQTQEKVGWTVPRQAVLKDGKGYYIFQVLKNRALRQNVERGIEESGMVQIQGSFDPALPVVILGNYELSDGMAVRE